MKIHEINKNANFYALRIPKKDAEQRLSKIGEKTFSKIDEVGELIKDTKFYNLYIEQEMYIRHINGNRLNPPYTVHTAGKSLMIGHKGYNQKRIKITFDTTKLAEEAKNNISASETQIERTAKIMKYLDDYEQKIAKDDTVIDKDLKEIQDEKIKNILKKYGV